jgi:alkylation response protein AidB-like acyl-CoA dehydrogenase
MIGLPGVGLKQTIRMFERVRCFVAIQAIGIAQAALDEALRYAKERVQWGKPIGGHQLVQAMIAEMATELDAARMLTLRGLHLLQKGVRCDTQTSMAKFYATETAIRVASKAVQIHGAYGISKEYPVEQMFRDARMMTIPDGTTEIQKLIIARNLLGIAAFGDMRRE